MIRVGRKLSNEEAAIWAQVAQTVTPIRRPAPKIEDQPRSQPAVSETPVPPKRIKGRVPAPLPPVPAPAKSRNDAQPHLDGSWERRILKGALVPDFSLDLHGAGLDAAYGRLMHGLMQARAMGARVVLVVTGKPRPVDPMDRSERRGAIRAKISDWLAASEHASDIVAIRGAHRRHGGQGALYIVLRRRR